MPKLIIIDPSLYTLGGHEYAMDLFLAQEATKLGYEPLVLSHLQFKDEAAFPCRPIFDYTPYSQNGESAKKDKMSYQKGNKSILRTLSSSLPSSEIPQNSVLLVHTACSSILTGMAVWLFRLKRTDIRVRLVIRWGVGHLRSSEELGKELFQHSFLAWKKLSCDVRFFVDSAPLRRHFENHFEGTFSCTPIGVDFSAFTEPPSYVEKDSYSFVFAGAPRMSKGGQFLAEAVIEHLIEYPNDRFRLHLLGLTSEEKALFMPLPLSRVQFVHNYLGGKKYIDYLLSGDAVIVPYSPTYYHLRTSHIFIEALGLGRAVVASNHPWMKEVLEETDEPRGVSMKEWSVCGLVEALREFRENAPALCQNALLHSASVREKHNPKAWLEFVLSK